MTKSKMILSGLAVVCMPAFSAPAADGVAFVQHGRYVSGAVVVAPANGGEYVYSSKPVDDGRGTQRFMLGQAPRQNYDLFSSVEEAALWRTRETQREAAAAANARARTKHVSRRVAPKLNWPKVVLVGDRTCVPQSAFASAAVWQQHLVCWFAGDRRVE